MGVGWLGLSHVPIELTSHIQLLEARKQSATTKHTKKKEDGEMTWTHLHQAESGEDRREKPLSRRGT